MKRIFCLWAPKSPRLREAAEACLILSPQVAVGKESVFVETAGSHLLFSASECQARLLELRDLFGLDGRLACAEDIPSAQAFARYGLNKRHALPIEALADYLSPFATEPFAPAAIFRRLGVCTVGDFLGVPRAELPARFGREGLLAYERYLQAQHLPWPRFQPAARLCERMDLEGAARVETLEPVLFVLKSLLDRIFLRLLARREQVVEFDLCFHLNRFSSPRERMVPVRLPLPQSDPRALLSLLQERLGAELARRPLESALEGVSITVQATAPQLDAQRDFFSKTEAKREAWASLAARLHERLGAKRAFHAQLLPRLRPELAWARQAEPTPGTAVPTPPRPLRLFPAPARLIRQGLSLQLEQGSRAWQILAFRGPERLQAEWWQKGFRRDYFRVETQTDVLWVFREGAALYLHGIFD